MQQLLEQKHKMIKAKNAASQMIDEYRNAGGRFADVSEKLKL